MVPRRHRVRTRAARGVSGGDCAQFISPLLRGASIVEIDHTGIIVRHIEPLGVGQFRRFVTLRFRNSSEPDSEPGPA